MGKDLVWFITGCSTGIGRAIASQVVHAGYKAVITARDVSKIADIAEGREQVLALDLDVTNKEQVAATVSQALARFGRIDVLVNNAGVGYFSSVEEGHEEKARKIFEVNFWGLMNMTKAVLPHMRGRCAGHIINISSVGGLATIPGVGYYQATKFAVEGITETLAQEVAGIGIKVTLVEPGGFRSDFVSRSAQMDGTTIDAYKPTVGYVNYVSSIQKQYVSKEPGNPARLAEVVVMLAESENPPLRLVLGASAYAQVVKKFKDFLNHAEAWKDVSHQVDFEPGT